MKINRNFEKKCDKMRKNGVNQKKNKENVRKFGEIWGKKGMKQQKLRILN